MIEVGLLWIGPNLILSPISSETQSQHLHASPKIYIPTFNQKPLFIKNLKFFALEGQNGHFG